MSQTLKATYDGEINLNGYKISCAVLNDKENTRVLAQVEIVKALGKSQGGSKRGEAKLPRWISAGNLTPYLSIDLTKAIINPIKYKTVKGNIALGVPAKFLPEICDVWLKAKDDGKLADTQLETSKRAEILMRGLALIGIIALVDEATGYEKVKRKDDLQLLLSAYVRKEFLPWTKRFPDEFYEQLFRLKNWSYNPMSVKRPPVLGKITENIVYKRIHPDVLKELKRLNPKNQSGNRSKRHHQFLTDDIGNPHLEKHLSSLITLMRISPNWLKFKGYVEKAFPIQNGQLNIGFPDLDVNEDD